MVSAESFPTKFAEWPEWVIVTDQRPAAKGPSSVFPVLQAAILYFRLGS